MDRENKFPTYNLSRHFWSIFLWNYLFLIFFEILMRFVTDGSQISLLSTGLFNSLQFSFALTLLIVCVIHLFPMRYHHILTVLWMSFIFLLFSSQLIYHDIFRTFYFFQSVENIGQGLGFKGVIYSTVVKNLWWLILGIVPIIIFILFKKNKHRKLTRLANSLKVRGVIIFCSLSGFFIFHYLAIWNVSLDVQASEMYYKRSSANLSADKLGLLTTVRIDIQRYLTGWSPKISPPPISEEPANGNYQNDDSIVDNDSELDDDSTRDDDLIEEPVEENKLNIPFDELIEQTENKEIAQMHKFFSKQQPSEKNEFTGKYKDYNLIWIVAEAYAPYAVREDLTPMLYKLSTEGYQFPNFYNPLWSVSTSDGEYTVLQSLVPRAGVWSFSESGENDLPFVMGNQLKNIGYTTKAYHNHTYDYYDRDVSHPNMGYDYKAVGNGLNISKNWPNSDLEMVEETIDEYINQEPFHVYYLTVSGHLEYNFIGNHMAMKNKHLVDDLDLSDEAKAYLAGQIELDRALEVLIDQLDKADVLDNTLIVMTGDHYPYGLENKSIEELTGEPVDEMFGIYENEWIMYAMDVTDEQVIVEEPTYTLDMLPTLANLMDIDFDSRLLMGRDVFSDAEPIVVFEDKSFITDQVKYYYPEDKVIPLTDAAVDEKHIKQMKQKTDEIFYYSSKILEHDYYRTLNLN